MQKYKINHICPSFNNQIYHEIVNRQLLLNDKIRVFYFTQKGTGHPNGEEKYVDKVSPFSFLDRFFYRIKEAKVYRSYKAIYGNQEFDFIHAHTLFTAGYIAYKERMKYGMPYVVAVRGSDINIFFKKRIHLRKIGIEIMRNAEMIVFISRVHKDEVFSKYLSPRIRAELENKTLCIPNGIDDFWHENEYVHPINKKGIIKLVYYGDIDKNKNVVATIEACEILMKKGYGVSYDVIGDVKRKEIFDYMSEKPYINYHEFAPKEEIIEYLRKADIFVMPSFSETFGLSYAEALSQGVPIIYTKGQGFDGIYPEGEVGYHVNPKRSDEIAERIEQILDNYQEISARCVHKSRDYNWNAIVINYQKLYDEYIKS